MGTLGGHLVAALLFLIVALYYSVLVSLALLRGQRFLKPPLPPRDKRGRRWWQLVSAEAVVKVVFSLIAILPELFYPPGTNRMVMVDWQDPKRPFVFKDTWQHVTMYGFFLFSGLVDLVSQACQAPEHETGASGEALAFCVLVLLMTNHIETKSALESRVHALFVLPAFLVALVLIIEVWVPDQPSLWVLKTWMGLVLSNWLLHLGVLMYAPPSGQPWSGDNPVDLAFVTTFFCWHLGLGAVVLAAIYSLCSLWYYRFSSWKRAPGAEYQPCPLCEGSEEPEKFRAGAPQLDGGV